jgi:MscS family membrane protein
MVDFSILSQYPVLSKIVFGNTLLQYLEALLMMLATVIAAKALYYVIKKYVQALVAKTETDLDDLLLKALETPVVFFVLIIGLNFSVGPLTLQPDVASVFSNLVKVLLTLDAAWIAAAVVDVFFEKFLTPYARRSRSKLDDQLVPILKNGANIIIFTLAILTVVSNFGYDITAVLGGLGIAGIAIGLAAQDSISNVIGSATIFTDRPFELEDAVKIGDVGGTVEEVGIRSTRIRTFDGTLVTMPNSNVAKSSIENYTKSSRRRIRVYMGVEYSTSSKKIEKAREVLKAIVRDTRGTDPDECSVLFMEFGDFALKLMFTYFITETSRFFEVQDEVNTKIKAEFEKAGIEFAFPSRTIYVKD